MAQVAAEVVHDAICARRYVKKVIVYEFLVVYDGKTTLFKLEMNFLSQTSVIYEHSEPLLHHVAISAVLHYLNSHQKILYCRILLYCTDTWPGIFALVNFTS